MRIALAQTEPLWEDKEGNFKAALTFLERAREQKADLVLFPEMSMTGFSMHPEKIGETGEKPRTLSIRESAGQALSAFCVVKVVSDEITIAEGFQLLPGKDFSQYVDNLRIVVAFLLTDGDVLSNHGF